MSEISKQDTHREEVYTWAGINLCMKHETNFAGTDFICVRPVKHTGKHSFTNYSDFISFLKNLYAAGWEVLKSNSKMRGLA